MLAKPKLTIPQGGLFGLSADNEHEEDINIESKDEVKIEIESKIESNNESNSESDIQMYSTIQSNSNIKINIKSNIKKTIKEKPEAFFTYLPKEYIFAIGELSRVSNYNKKELSEMAFSLLFKKFGLEFIKE